MNIHQIKARAQELVAQYNKPFIRTLTLVMLLVSLGDLLGNTTPDTPLFSFVSIVILILFLTVPHGDIVASLKVVRHTGHTLSDDDAFVGFKKFKQLFPTYLLMGCFEFIAMFLVIIFGVVLLGGVMVGLLSSLTLGVQGVENALMSAVLMNPSFLLTFLVVFIMIVSIAYIVSLYLFAVPYLLERYHMVNMRAIKESVAIMKGHKYDLFRLDLSFLGWIILSGLLAGMLSQFVSGLGAFGYALTLVLTGLFQIYTFKPKYLVSRAIFFEELAYERYEQIHEDAQADDCHRDDVEVVEAEVVDMPQVDSTDDIKDEA